MAGRLAGKTAFITAAAQGMGQAAALAFAREGARVWATDINAQQLKSIEGKDAIRTRQLDVTDEPAIARIAQEVGDVDVVFNCAGIVHNGSILEASAKDWDQAMSVNVRSMFLVARAFLPGMLKKQKGSIINMASVASSIKGLPNRCVYSASKAAVIGLTKSIAADYVRQGIRCNAIAPGFMDTPMGRDASRRRADRAITVPFGRQGTGWEVAYAALFLISNESSYVNAQTLFLDAGHMGGIVRS